MSQEQQTPQGEEQYPNSALPVESQDQENAESQTMKRQEVNDIALKTSETEEEPEAKIELANQIVDKIIEVSDDYNVDAKVLNEQEQVKPQEVVETNEEVAESNEIVVESNEQVAQPKEEVVESKEEVVESKEEETQPKKKVAETIEEDKSNIIQENIEKKEEKVESSEKNEISNNNQNPLKENDNQPKTENQKVEDQPQSATEEQDPQMYTVEKRIQMANELNNQARELIKKKNHSEALVLYQKALELTNPTYFRYVGDEMKKEYQTLSVNLLNNLAFCYFHLGNYLVSAQISEQTLIIDSKNLKAMYRRAICYKNLKDYERAFEIIKTAVKNGGNESKEIYAEYESIKALHKEYVEQYKQKEKEVYGRMMSSANQQKIQEEKEKELLREKAALEVASDTQTLVNSLFFFGSTAFSFLVASKIFKIDVSSKTGFSLAGSISASLYGAYHFENKYTKGIFGLCAFILFGYMMNKKSIAN